MNNFNFIGSSEALVKAIEKWRKQLAVFVLIVAAGSFFFSSPLFIKPKYKSTAIIYPYGIKPYGEESSTEQLLQYIKAQDIRDSIIRTFHLYKRYELDSVSPFHYTNVNQQFDENIKFTKTEYEFRLILQY